MELNASCMSGPYTCEEAKQILRRPFYTLPLIVAEQDYGPNPPKLRVCHNFLNGDKFLGTGLVNSFVEKEFFPTHFDMAQNVEDVMSQISSAVGHVFGTHGAVLYHGLRFFARGARLLLVYFMLLI